MGLRKIVLQVDADGMEVGDGGFQINGGGRWCCREKIDEMEKSEREGKVQTQVPGSIYCGVDPSCQLDKLVLFG